VASEDIGQIYKTQIPGYEDAADIQAALRLYHYGSNTVPSVETIGVSNGIIANSVAGHLKSLDNRLDIVEVDPARSTYSETEPSGSTLVDGYIWIDANTSVQPDTTYVTASYSASAPTEDLIVGTLWVDSNSSPLKMYIWSGSEWRVIGE
jgi:hypothetical protein